MNKNKQKESKQTKAVQDTPTVFTIVNIFHLFIQQMFYLVVVSTEILQSSGSFHCRYIDETHLIFVSIYFV